MRGEKGKNGKRKIQLSCHADELMARRVDNCLARMREVNGRTSKSDALYRLIEAGLIVFEDGGTPDAPLERVSLSEALDR